MGARRQGTVDKQGSPRVSLRRRGRAESAQCFAAAMGSGANSLTRGALHIFVQSTLSACRAQRMVFFGTAAPPTGPFGATALWLIAPFGCLERWPRFKLHRRSHAVQIVS